MVSDTQLQVTTVMDRFFEWAESQGMTNAQLAKCLRYSERQIYRFKAGDSSDKDNFEARAIAAFGDEVRVLFENSVWHADHILDDCRRPVKRERRAD